MYGSPHQVMPGNVRPQPSYMSPKGRFSSAPPGIMQGYGTLHRGNTSVLGYGQNNDAFHQANAIYAGLPGGNPSTTPHSPTYHAVGGGGMTQNPLYSPVMVSPSAAAAYTPEDIYRTIDAEAGIASWYLVGRPRPQVKKIAVEILKNGRIGEFFVRDISSHPGCLGMSIKTNKNDLMNYLLQPQPGGAGISVRGTKEVFPNLTKLINHYMSRKRPSLPVQLKESSIRGVWGGRKGKGKKGKKTLPKKKVQKHILQDKLDAMHADANKTTPPQSPDDDESDNEKFDGFGGASGNIGDTITKHLEPYNKDSAVSQYVTSHFTICCYKAYAY